MNVIELLTSRRSIRKYTDKEVADELIEKLLIAGMYAPSAGNQQPWHFLVIKDKTLLTKITEFHPYAKMLPNASVAILVCADTQLETKIGYWHIDCSAASQNILIAAHGLGLGAVWLGIYPRPERQEGMRELFHLPQNIEPFSLISVGYAAEEKPTPERFKADRVHTNKW
jgi:nitroreductase